LGMEIQESLLRVRDLSVSYVGRAGAVVRAVDRASFEIAAGETVGIMGESGGGKSTLALAIVGLLPEGAATVTGSVRWSGRELVGCRERELRRVRGAEVSIIFQEPGLALNPVLTVGRQVAEVARAHRAALRQSPLEAASRALAEVGHEPERFFHRYPHQLSGGEQQRAVIAQALVCRPRLVIADEPTASLDATVQLEILELLRDLKERLRISFLFISHNPAVLSFLADRVLTMYAGRVVESGTRRQVFGDPLHPYTRGLLAAMPVMGTAAAGRTPFVVIPGGPPELRVDLLPGCRFEERCPVRMDVCAERDPIAIAAEGGHGVSCFQYGGNRDAD
jgi:oligopeptide/dipeptide ABC transporter ATP-binding protein